MDSKRLAAIYDNLLKLNMDINFKDTPTPAYIQEKVIQCNEYQRKVEKYFVEATRDFSQYERRFRTEKLNVEILRRQTLTNNEKIKKLPTGKEREAAVDELLEPQHKKLLELENAVNSHKDLLSAVRAVQASLKSTNSDIKTLVRLMEQIINRLNVGSTDDPDVRELKKTLSEIDDSEIEDVTIDDVESSSDYHSGDDSGDESESGDLQQKLPSEDDGQDDSGDGKSDEDFTDSFLVDDSSDLQQQPPDDETWDGENEGDEGGGDPVVATTPDTGSKDVPTASADPGSSLDMDLSDLGIDLDGESKETSKETSTETSGEDPGDKSGGAVEVSGDDSVINQAKSQDRGPPEQDSVPNEKEESVEEESPVDSSLENDGIGEIEIEGGSDDSPEESVVEEAGEGTEQKEKSTSKSEAADIDLDIILNSL